MSADDDKIWSQLNKIVTVIPKSYVDALIILSDRLDSKNLKWVIDGDLAECLKVIPVTPDKLEIVTSKEGACGIFEELKDFNPSPLAEKTFRLPRDALVGEKTYSVFSKSHYFDFYLKDVPVIVQGDLQFRVNEWDWGEVYDFDPDYVFVTGKKIAVTPLEIRYQLYQSLGWFDRANNIHTKLYSLRKSDV